MFQSYRDFSGETLNPQNHELLHLKVPNSSEDPFFDSSIKELLQTLFQQSICSDHFTVNRISGALTNAIYKVTIETLPSILLRIYGISSSEFICREQEMFWLTKLASNKVVPRVIACFQNGRVEEYIESETLTKDVMRQDDISSQIAVSLAELHQCNLDEKIKKSGLWDKLRQWQGKALKSLENRQEYSGLCTYIGGLTEDINKLENTCEKLDFCLCHNDVFQLFKTDNLQLQYGNILRLKQGKIIFVDFEYAGVNYREYDIANHFIEWMADYHSDTPHILDSTKYPTDIQQQKFIHTYLTTLNPSIQPTIADITKVQQRVKFFTLCSHLMWTFWGIFLEQKSDINFDYLGYSLGRLELYKSGFNK